MKKKSSQEDQVYIGKVLSLIIHPEELSKLQLREQDNPFDRRKANILKVNLAKLQNDLISFSQSGSYYCTLIQLGQIIQEALCYHA